MNAVERVLDGDVNALLERLAASVPQGCLEAITPARPGLKQRLDEVEARLTTTRTALLESYGLWRRTLEDLENLWALAAWRSTAEDPPEQARSLAA